MIAGTIAYKRPKIFEIWAQANREAGLDLMAIVSCNDTERIAKREGIIYERMPNYPLGVKANRRLELIKELGADGIMLLGSDDIVNKAYVQYVEDNRLKYDMMSNMDIYYYDHNIKGLYYSDGYKKGHFRYGENMAVGRYFSYETLSEFNFKLWDEGLNKNLDGNSYKKTRHLSNNKAWLRDTDRMVLDIKSGFNLTPMSRLKPLRLSDEFLIDKFSSNVIDMLK